jgi:hypothetical protein
MRAWVREAEGGEVPRRCGLCSQLGQRGVADAAAVVVALALCFLPLRPGLLCSGLPRASLWVVFEAPRAARVLGFRLGCRCRCRLGLAALLQLGPSLFLKFFAKSILYFFFCI